MATRMSEPFQYVLLFFPFLGRVVVVITCLYLTKQVVVTFVFCGNLRVKHMKN